MTEYGVDVSTFPDLDGTGRNITDGRAIAECVTRRLMTAPGVLEYADDDDCLDLRGYLSAGMNSREIFSLSTRIESVAERDERVAAASAELVIDGDALLVTVQIEPVTGKDFKLVIAVTKISVTLLQILET